MLVEYFVQRYAKRAGKDIQSIDKKTVELFRSYNWPGNIRKLQNVIERSVILTSGHVLSVDESWLSKEPPAGSSRVPGSLTFEDERRKERKFIEGAQRPRLRADGGSGQARNSTVDSSVQDQNSQDTQRPI